MKAIIVKNNDFKTIGFEVTVNARTLFSWGIAPVVSMYFIKEVNVKDWMPEIAHLIKLKGIMETQQDFKSLFFSTLSASGELKSGFGYNMQAVDERIDQTKHQIENIIKNII